MDGYTLTLAANPWNIVRTYNLTPGRELLFACRYRLGTASNFVVYMSEADNVYDPLYGSFVGDQGVWSTAKMFGGSIPGLVQQSAGTLDLYSMQIRASAFEGESVSVTERARQEAPGVEAPVPAPHQAQQGAQEDRVSPQVAAVQVCDGLEGAGRRGSAPAFQNRRRESEARRRPPAAGPCEELTTPYFPKYFSCIPALWFIRKTQGAQCCTALHSLKTLGARRYTETHSRTRPDCPENSVSVLLCSSALTDSPPGFPASNLTSNVMGKIKLFPTPEYSSKQPSDPVVPLVPCTGILLGPSKPGKTVTLISLILEQYRGVFERIYIFSPIDDGWIPVKKYIEQDLGVNTEREQAYWDEWDEAALRRIIQQQRKITEASKKLEMKKLYQVLIICDDLADVPQLHRPNGALDTLFIRGRHMQISTWVSSQKLRLISAAVRVNQQFLCCWRLRNQHELDAVVEELCRLYEQATREPYSFLFVHYLKPKNEMFFIRFEERFVIENGWELPGPEAVR